LERVNAVDPAFQSHDVKVRTFEVELIPAQVNRLSHPQAVASHYQD
jgi:hypothetical protein